MKKILAVMLSLFLSISLFGFISSKNTAQLQLKTQAEVKAEAEIRSLVKGFGSRLQLVSLLAPKDMVKKSMKENYGNYVTKQLLAKWMNNPTAAPGRLTSSPWPDRININSVRMLSKIEYVVKGEIIEITSAEKTSNGVFAKRPITLTVTRSNNKWLINKAVLGAYELEKPLSYLNTKYGFVFSLPVSWKGYRIITGSWEGLPVDSSGEKKSSIVGPMLTIRHPGWTTKVQRQDIPIMIFSLKQWNLISQDKYHIGAAPIGPQELGRNNRYVFALPARYNFAFPKGYEEVENIIKGKPLHPISNK